MNRQEWKVVVTDILGWTWPIWFIPLMIFWLLPREVADEISEYRKSVKERAMTQVREGSETAK